MGREQEWLRWVVLAGLALACDAGGGQTLAHKNWEGSGLTVQAWWSRAVFCAAGSDLKKVVGEIDVLGRMGCDAVEVEPGSGYGAAAEMDGVMEAVGRRGMRVVVDLDGGEQEVREQMGFWGARGAAGFAVRSGVARLRQAAGGRLLIGEGGQLTVRRIPEADAAGLRAWLSGMGATRQGIMLEDGGGRLGYARAAMLLASGMAARIRVDGVVAPDAGEAAPEFSEDEMLLWVPKARAVGREMAEWVRGLSELHHQRAALRAGQAVFLDFDATGVVGWVVQARDGRGAVLVVCNVSGKAVRVAAAGAVRGSGVRGTYLKAVLRPDGDVGGGDTLDGIGLAVDGAFVGEVR